MTNRPLFLVSLLILFILNIGFAQSDERAFNVECHDVEVVEKEQEVIKERYKKKLKNYKHKKQFLTELETRHTRYLDQIDNEEYYCEPLLDDVLQRLLSQLIENNEALTSKEVNLLVGRYPWPNASFIGDNTIVVNLGLLLQLKTEDELAFILSHELAHLYLDHLDNDMKSYLNRMNSKETKKKLKKIKRSKYKKYSQAESLLKNYVYDHRKHSRNHEFEADSMGFVFFKNAGFDQTGAINALSILDQVDSIAETNLSIETIFDFSEFPFQKNWTQERKALFGGKVKENTDWNVDSLKTHPKCKERIEVIASKVSKSNKGSKPLFDEFRNELIKEEIRSYIHFGHIDLAFIKAVSLYNDSLTNVIGIQSINKILSVYYDLRANHVAGKFVGNVNKSRTENLKQIRLFLKNIRTKDLAKLRYHFAEREIQSDTDLDLELSKYYLAKAAKDALMPNKDQLKKDFESEYPDSKYKLD